MFFVCLLYIHSALDNTVKSSVMKATSVSFNDYAVSASDIQRVKESIGDLDSLFNAVKGIPGVGFLKMEDQSIKVLDVNSYPLLTIYVDERYEDSIFYRFNI